LDPDEGRVMERLLAERCPECGWPTREEIREFRGEKLAVSCCLNPKCEFFDWETPRACLDNEGGVEDWDLFEESQMWALKKADEMKISFLSQRPVKFVVEIDEGDVDRWLKEQFISESTREAYRGVLMRFLRWLRER